MGDTHGVLFDDRTFIKVGGDIMRCCANQFDPAHIGLLIRVGTLEAWQEGMVDIDDLATHFLAQAVREDLHVAVQNDQLDIIVRNNIKKLFLGFGLVFLGNRDVVEGNIVINDNLLIIKMV